MYEAISLVQNTDRLLRLIRKENVERIADEPQGLAEGFPRVFFVDSGSGRALSSNTGLEPLAPFATLAQAITAAIADRGDVIMVAAGHAETLAAAVTVNKSGLTIQGLGTKRSRPAFTISGAVDGLDVTAANVKIDNLYFPGPTGAATAFINIGAADVEVSNCEFIADADATECITIPDAGDRAYVHDCIFRVTANGPTSGVRIEAAGTEGVVLKNLRSFGMSVANAWDNAFLYSTVAHTDCFVEDIYNDFGPTLVFTAAATGLLKDIWPGEISETANGYQLVGGACGLVGGPEEGYRINRATADIITGAAVDLLTITGGRMQLMNLLAEVTTVIGAVANNLSFQANPTNTGNTTNALCAATAITNDTVGTMYALDGVAATGLVVGESGGVNMVAHMPKGIAIWAGALESLSSADTTGSIKLALWVKKIDPACIWAWT